MRTIELAVNLKGILGANNKIALDELCNMLGGTLEREFYPLGNIAHGQTLLTIEQFENSQPPLVSQGLETLCQFPHTAR